jgi:hypothetical protein
MADLVPSLPGAVAAANTATGLLPIDTSTITVV